MNRYYNPVRTVEGPGCARQLPALLGEMNLERRKILLLVWDQSVLEHPAFVGLLREHAYEVRPLVFQASNPTVEQLYEVYRQTRAFQPEVVIAVGGGSILDVGKSLCCLYGAEIGSEDELRAAKGRAQQKTEHSASPPAGVSRRPVHSERQIFT